MVEILQVLHIYIYIYQPKRKRGWDKFLCVKYIENVSNISLGLINNSYQLET